MAADCEPSAGEACELVDGIFCAAAIDVLTEVGTPEALPALEKCAVRFAATPFLPFAISMAITRISGAKA